MRGNSGGEFKPDWEGDEQRKWEIMKVEKEYKPWVTIDVKACPKLGHFAEESHGKEIIEGFQKELDIIFN